MKIVRVFSIITLLSILAACSSPVASQVEKKPTPPVNKAGTATVFGQVLSMATGKPFANQAVRLAEVFYDDGEPYFILDAAFSPGTVADANGNFVFSDVPPNEYVITVGDFFDVWKPYVENGKSKVYKIEADQVYDVGVIQIELQN